MFPHARNSLRRWSASENESESEQQGSSGSGSKKVPIPIGVSLHNVVRMTTPSAVSPSPSSQDDAGNDNMDTNKMAVVRSSFQRRPRHEIHLLPLLQLEVLVDENENENDDDDDDDVADEDDDGDVSGDIPTSSSSSNNNNNNQNSQRIVYKSPTLSRSVQPEWEHLDERIELPGEWWRKRGGLYKSMRLRILQVSIPSAAAAAAAVVPEVVEPPETKGTIHEEKDDTTSSSSSSTVFLEIPLYPSKLKRLHRDNDNNNSNNDDGDVEESLQALPPNACLVYFSDGSTRCSQSLFSVLLKHNLTEPSPMEDFSRFEDDVFRHLDGTPQARQRPRSESISALLEPPPPQEDNDLNSRLLMEEFDGCCGSPTLEDVIVSSKSADESTVVFDESEDTALQVDSQKERERLLAMIAREENQLQEEVTWLQEEKEELASLLQEANEVERHIQLVEIETKKQTIDFRKDEFRKEAQHMKLLRELQTVYPITMGDLRKGYLIRNLRLPVDIYTTTVPEEEISAALGFCCHLVFMISKYLSISMRYRLFCNSSRSAIQLDGSTFLPLFSARSVEREHLDHAMGLLGANVDCILMSLGIEYTPKSHILARLKRVYDQIIEGEIPLLGIN